MSLHKQFTVDCISAFRRLVEHYGFEEPIVKPISRETFVEYHRGHRTVSVAYDAFSSPIVELFYPSSETGGQPAFWAERNGIARSRRIPRLDVAVRFDRDNPNFIEYLTASAEALERVEREWLKP